MNRREAIVGLSAFVTDVALLNGCAPATAPRPTDRVVRATAVRPTETPVTLLSAQEFATLSPYKRIDALERRQYEPDPDFDPNKEMANASVEVFCEHARCNIPPQEIAANIFFKEMDEIVELSQQDRGRPYTSAEKLQMRNKILGFTSGADRKIYINYQAIEADVARPDNAHLKSQFGGRDVGMILKKSVIMHEIGHRNQLDIDYPLPPLTIDLVGRNAPGVITLERFSRFTMIARKSNGEAYIINGSNEIVAESVGNIIGEKTGIYLFTDPDYKYGVEMLGRINKRAGISDGEFLEYADGRKSKDEFLRKVGSIRGRNEGIIALAMLGLRTQGLVQEDQADQYLNNFLTPQNPRR